MTWDKAVTHSVYLTQKCGQSALVVSSPILQWILEEHFNITIWTRYGVESKRNNHFYILMSIEHGFKEQNVFGEKSFSVYQRNPQ